MNFNKKLQNQFLPQRCEKKACRFGSERCEAIALLGLAFFEYFLGQCQKVFGPHGHGVGVKAIKY